MKTNLETWSPFQSPDVHEICAHMTESERAAASRRGMLYGIWTFATFAGPMSCAAVYRHPTVIFVAVVLITIHVVCIPKWLTMQRRFLCSTFWARVHGYTPDGLRLFAFRR